MVLFKNYSLSETDTDQPWRLDCPPIIGNSSSPSRVLPRPRKRRQTRLCGACDSRAGWVSFSGRRPCSGIPSLSSLKEQALVAIGCPASLSAAKDSPFADLFSVVRRVRGPAPWGENAQVRGHQLGPVSPASSLAVGRGPTCVFPVLRFLGSKVGLYHSHVKVWQARA